MPHPSVSYESRITLSAMAGVTRRLRLLTAALLAPLYNTGIAAKQTASLDALCGIRLTPGLGIGSAVCSFPVDIHVAPWINDGSAAAGFIGDEIGLMS